MLSTFVLGMQVRYCVYLPTQLIAVVCSLFLMPAVCAAAWPGAAQHWCTPALVLLVAVVGLVLPTFVVRRWESCLRSRFLSQLQVV